LNDNPETTNGVQKWAPLLASIAHRSAIMNVSRVREIGRVGLGKYCVRLNDGRQLLLSRDRRRGLHAALRELASRSL